MGVVHQQAMILKHNVFVQILIQALIAHKSCVVIVQLHVIMGVNVLMDNLVIVRRVMEE
jgi:hypothetical protein